MTPALQSYRGLLLLDSNDTRAYLAHRDDAGTLVRILMMMDTELTGDADLQRITAAWQFFSTKPGIENGAPITVEGYFNYLPNSNVPVIHVVRA